MTDSKKKVLLLSMPFVSVRYPSPALSLLKAVLQEEGVQCDLHYLNIFFQAFTRRPKIYEGIADLIMVWWLIRRCSVPEIVKDQE